MESYTHYLYSRIKLNSVRCEGCIEKNSNSEYDKYMVEASL